MKGERLRQHGVFVALRRGETRPRRFQVIGERCSGTNYLHHLVRKNLPLKPSSALGWKHGFPSAVAVAPDLLVVVVARRADDWARSLYARPWHANPGVTKHGFPEFIRSAWRTKVRLDVRARLAPWDARMGQALQWDRHPLTGRSFGNIFMLRNAKLSAHMGYMFRAGNVLVVPLERVADDPERFITETAEAFALTPRSPFRPADGTYGHHMFWRKRDDEIDLPPETLSDEDRAFMLSKLDMKQERRFGYTYER
ncbi:hypothetical protein ACW9UR_11875 [Halovulum sp. GXIMD14794]